MDKSDIDNLVDRIQKEVCNTIYRRCGFDGAYMGLYGYGELWGAVKLSKKEMKETI